MVETLEISLLKLLLLFSDYFLKLQKAYNQTLTMDIIFEILLIL